MVGVIVESFIEMPESTPYVVTYNAVLSYSRI